MKRVCAMVAALLILVSCTAIAESTFDLSSLSYEELTQLGHELIEEIRTRPEWSSTSPNQDTPAVTNTPISNVNPSMKVDNVSVANYVGLNLSNCGYTSMGGDRRDYYGSTSLLLVLFCPDGTYIDPTSKAQLQEYTVIGQSPMAGTQFTISSTLDDKLVNKGFEEITLFVVKNGEDIPICPVIVCETPSPCKETHYVRDYVGRNLETVGYSAMNGKRYDYYGPDGRVQLSIMDKEGRVIDPSDHSTFKYYVVTSQNTEPDTRIEFTYTVDGDGEGEVTSQTLSVIQITVEMSEVGRAQLKAIAEEEEVQRASGALFEIYKGTYVVGTDLSQGNYKFTSISASDACSINIYADKDAFDNDDGDWGYIYGDGDSEYYYLREGMYVKITQGTAKALRSDFDVSGPKFQLFAGVYHVGVDIEPGNYEFRQISDSCSINTYSDGNSYINEDGVWDYLYGEEDFETYALKNGMVFTISGGAVSVSKK